MLWMLAAAPALRMAPPVMHLRDNVGVQQSTEEFASVGSSATGSSGRVVPIRREAPIVVQGGGSLRTWSYASPAVEQVQVVLSSEGRPVEAEIELWHGPGNTPAKARVYVEDGARHPFSCVIETPRSPNTVAIRNVGPEVFPLSAGVYTEDVDAPSDLCIDSLVTVQGGALRTFPIEPGADSTQVLLETDGRPLNARIELLQGPNNNKQVVELYTEDGCDRPFFCVLETPEAHGVVRIVNTAPMAFPMAAAVVPNFVPNFGMAPGMAEGMAGGMAGTYPPRRAEPTRPEPTRPAPTRAEVARSKAAAAAEVAREAVEARREAQVARAEADAMEREAEELRAQEAAAAKERAAEAARQEAYTRQRQQAAPAKKWSPQFTPRREEARPWEAQRGAAAPGPEDAPWWDQKPTF